MNFYFILFFIFFNTQFALISTLSVLFLACTHPLPIKCTHSIRSRLYTTTSTSSHIRSQIITSNCSAHFTQVFLLLAICALYSISAIALAQCAFDPHSGCKPIKTGRNSNGGHLSECKRCSFCSDSFPMRSNAKFNETFGFDQNHAKLYMCMYVYETICIYRKLHAICSVITYMWATFVR